MPATGRHLAPLVAMSISLAIEAGLVHLMSKHGDFLQKGEAWKFTTFGMLAGIAYWFAVVSACKAKFTARRGNWVCWLAAVALRIIILPVAPGDDIWRYRWEGMIQLHGFSPYQSSPDSPELIDLRNSDWSKINHRNFPAIYPPLTEAVFAGVAASGNSVWLYKGLFALTDLAGIAVLRRLLVRSGVDARQAVWYAWNPLVIYAFAGAAHLDSLMILFLLGAIWTIHGHADAAVAPATPRRCWPSALLLGLAIAIKIAPVVLLPVWCLAMRPWRRVAILLPVTLAPLAISAFIYGYPGVPVFSTLRQFGTGFRVNEPVWWLFDEMGWSNPLGNNLLPGGGALMACAGLAWWFRRDWQRGLFWAWGTALLLSPVVHAWYVVWVLPLAAWRGNDARAWFVFSISTFGYFLLWEVNHASGKPWEEPLWLRTVILLPPLVAVAWMRTGRRHLCRLR